jgi:hypothetical protein
LNPGGRVDEPKPGEVSRTATYVFQRDKDTTKEQAEKLLKDRTASLTDGAPAWGPGGGGFAPGGGPAGAGGFAPGGKKGAGKANPFVGPQAPAADPAPATEKLLERILDRLERIEQRLDALEKKLPPRDQK